MIGALQMMPAQVVAAALEQRHLDRHGQGIAHGGQVPGKELILQGLGARGHDDLAAFEQRATEPGLTYEELRANLQAQSKL